MSDFVKAVRTAEVAPGGMKTVELNGHQFVICNCDGTFYAIDRRCGHMNAPLEMGTLDGTIVTCGMHCAQFDVTTGEVLSGPVPGYLGNEVPSARVAALLMNVARFMQHVRTEPIGCYPAKVEADWVWIAV
ncbi:MAG TPA: Rieske 2Fe-2S domain-containing protein [Myxococcaceae bacterium]|nr:Rieske 2Fe-2S domain-containing protein [Myxococcaceae bacterium]